MSIVSDACLWVNEPCHREPPCSWYNLLFGHTSFSVCLLASNRVRGVDSTNFRGVDCAHPSSYIRTPHSTAHMMARLYLIWATRS